MGMIIIFGGVVLVVAIIVICLLCKGISASRNPLAQFFMILLLVPLLGVAGYICYVGVEIFSDFR